MSIVKQTIIGLFYILYFFGTDKEFKTSWVGVFTFLLILIINMFIYDYIDKKVRKYINSLS